MIVKIKIDVKTWESHLKQFLESYNKAIKNNPETEQVLEIIEVK